MNADKNLLEKRLADLESAKIGLTKQQASNAIEFFDELKDVLNFKDENEYEFRAGLLADSEERRQSFYKIFEDKINTAINSIKIDLNKE